MTELEREELIEEMCRVFVDECVSTFSYEVWPSTVSDDGRREDGLGGYGYVRLLDDKTQDEIRGAMRLALKLAEGKLVDPGHEKHES